MSTPVPPQRNQEPFVLLHKSSVHVELCALTVLFVILFLVRFHAFLNLNSHILGGARGDSGLYLWLARRGALDFFSLPWFSTHAFYPYSQSLAFSDNFILPALVVHTLQGIGVPFPLAYNLLFLCVSLLNGYCLHRLIFALGGNTLVSIAAGALMLSSSSMSSQMGHPQLQFIFFFPLLIELLFRYLAKPKTVTALFAGLSLFFCFACSVYYAIFLSITVVLLSLGIFLLRPRHFSIKEWCLFAVRFGFGLIPLIPFIPPYFSVRSTFGARGTYEAYYFSATIRSYFSASPLSALYAWTSGFSHDEAHLFNGFIVLFLASLALIRLGQSKQLRVYYAFALYSLIGASIFSDPALFPWLSPRTCQLACALLLWVVVFSFGWLIYYLGFLERKLKFTFITNRDLLALFTVLGLVFYVMSFGPLGLESKHQWMVGPFKLMYLLFPGLNSIRAIARCGLVTNLFLIILGALGLTYHLKEKKISSKVAILLLTVALAENWQSTFPLEPETRKTELAALVAQLPPAPGALIMLPFSGTLDKNGNIDSWGEFAEIQTNAMNTFSLSARPLVNGYSGQRTKLMYELPRELRNFPNERSLNAFEKIVGLRYIVYQLPENTAETKASFLKKAAGFGERLSLLLSDGAGAFVFEFTPHTPLKSDSYLLVPSIPEGKIVLEMQATGPIGATQVGIEVLKDDGDDTSSLLSALIPLDQPKYTLSIPLKKSDLFDSVRPLKLRFKPSKDTQVLLIRSQFVYPGDE